MVAFAGCVAITRRAVFDVYPAALLTTLGAVTAVVGVDRPALDTANRALFAGLLGLGGYVVWRGVRARRTVAAVSYDRAQGGVVSMTQVVMSTDDEPAATRLDYWRRL